MCASDYNQLSHIIFNAIYIYIIIIERRLNLNLPQKSTSFPFPIYGFNNFEFNDKSQSLEKVLHVSIYNL